MSGWTRQACVCVTVIGVNTTPGKNYFCETMYITQMNLYDGIIIMVNNFEFRIIRVAL